MPKIISRSVAIEKKELQKAYMKKYMAEKMKDPKYREEYLKKQKSYHEKRKEK